jgi:hypothetical protein
MVSQQNARIAAGEPITPMQAQTQKAFEGLRSAAAYTPEEQDVFDALRDELSSDPSRLERIFSGVVDTGLDPDSYYTSTFKPQLDLAFDDINRQAAQRGLVTSGIPIEMSQRAAAELAIREAESRQNFRRQALADVQDLFNVSQGLRSRNIGIEGAAVDLASGRERDITDLLARSTSSASDRQDALGQRTTQRFGAIANYERLLDDERKKQISESIGRALGTAAGGFVGGPAGAAAGGQVGASMFGGSKGGSASDLLTQSRSAASTPSRSIAPSSKLTRLQSDDELFAELAQLLRR